MASNLNEILGRNIDSVKALKTAIKELQDSLVGLDTDSEQFKTTTAQLAVAQAELNKVTKAGKDENVAAKDSLVGMRQEYKALYDQYKLLTEEQRKSDFGKVMADSLETLSNKINDTQKGIGDFRGNVGRYAQSITDAFNGMGISLGALQTPLKLATGGANTFGKALKTLAANPIILILTGLVAILVKAAEAIKKNEELTMRLQQAMSAFRPILDAVSNAFDFLAEKLVSFVEWLGDATQKIREFGASITDWLGITDNAKEELQEQNKVYQDLAKSQNELTKKRRDYLKLNSESQKNLDKLRSEAAATTDLTEKKKLLTDAQALQEEINNRNLEIAQEELRVLEVQASLTANDAEMNEKLAAAQAKVNNVQAEGARKMKELNEQLKSTNSTIKTTTTSITNYREKAKELYEQLVEDNKDELTKLTEKYEKERKLLVKYGYDTNLLDKKFSKDSLEIVVKTINERMEKEREMYTNSLREYNKYIQQQRELLKDSPTELAEFDKEISEEILERYSNIKKALLASQRKMFQEGSFDLVNAFTVAQSNANSQLLLTDFEGMLKLLKDNIEATAGAEKDSFEGIWHEIYEGALKAMEKLGPEKWAAFTKPIQEQIDSLRTAYGVSIETLEELGRLTEIEEKNLKALKKAFTEALGEEQLKKIQDAIKENYVAELEGLIKTVSYDTFEGYTVFMAEQEAKALEVEKSAIEEQLNNFSGTTEQKLEIMKRYYEVLAEMREKDQALNELNQQRTSEMVENLIDASDRMGSALGTWKQTRESVIDSELKAGKISEQEATKQKKRLLTLERLERDFAIATIIADAASGAFSIWKGYATEVGVINAQTAAAAGPGAAVAKAALDAKSLVSAIAKTAGLAATATAQIAAAQGKYVVAKNNMSAESGGGGSVGVAATPMVIDSSPVTWTKTVQTAEEEDRLNQPIYVTVTDIEEGLSHRAQVTNESSF